MPVVARMPRGAVVPATGQDRHGAECVGLAAVCRAHYGTVLMLRREWERAEVELTEAAAVLARTPEGADAFARLGGLRRRQGAARRR